MNGPSLWTLLFAAAEKRQDLHAGMSVRSYGVDRVPNKTLLHSGQLRLEGDSKFSSIYSDLGCEMICVVIVLIVFAM
jgi:hypothetical protein